MHIYRGKFNWEDYATNEPFTIIFPGDFDLGEDAFASWTFDDKTQVILTGSIDSVNPVKNQIELFSSSAYWIDVTFALNDRDKKTLTVNVHHSFSGIKTSPKTAKLCLVHPDKEKLRSKSLAASPISRIYYGTLTTANSNAKKELFILVIPHTVLAGEHLCAYWMWSDAKTNVDVTGSISSVTGSTIAFTDGSGNYAIAGDDPGAVSSMKVSLTYSNTTTSISLTLAPTPALGEVAYVEHMPPSTPGHPSNTVITPSKQKISSVDNDLPEPVWGMIYEADAPEPSTLSSWLGLGLSVVGMHPALNQPYAITVGALSLILSTIGVYDAVRAGPEVPESDVMNPSQSMWRASLHRGPEDNQTANAATLLRVHVADEKKVVITRAQLLHLRSGRTFTSEIFTDSKITTELFSIVMPDKCKMRPFRIFEIRGLLPEQGTSTADDAWFTGPAAVSFTRGEMATVNTLTTDRKTLTRRGNLSVDYADTTTLFKYNKDTLMLCVEDDQTTTKDGYDFFWVSNTVKLSFLRLTNCKADSVTDKRDIGFMHDSQLRERIGVIYRGYDLYWCERRYNDVLKKTDDYLFAGRLNENMIIRAAPKSQCWVMIRVTNWHTEMRMTKIS